MNMIRPRFILVVTCIFCIAFSSCDKEEQISLSAPEVMEIQPTGGVAGMEVTITGLNFVADTLSNTVTFSGVVATVKEASVDELVVVVPEGGETGAIEVSTSGGKAISPVFTYYQIYVLGTVQSKVTNNNVITLWRNGVPEVVSDDAFQSHSTSIALSGDDVYISGTVYNGKLLPAYWKNGQEIILTTGKEGRADAVVVDGDDVYVAGSEFIDGRYVAKYWKNGVGIDLTLDNPTYAFAEDIKIADGDVYVVGNRTVDDYSLGVVWKNGIEIEYGEAFKNVLLRKIEVVDGDIYLLGLNWVNNQYAISYWENGIEHSLTDGTYWSGANGFFIDENRNVLVAGTELNERNIAVAKVWINGDEYVLSDGSSSFRLSDIAVINGDIITTGYIEIENSNEIAFYAINDQLFTLTGRSSSLSISGLAVF